MRIILLILSFILLSFWLTIIIGIGVSAGIKNAFDRFSDKENKNESI